MLRSQLNRRKFLKTLGLGAGALVVSGRIGWSQEPLKIGIMAPRLLDVGTSTIRGATIAIDEINEQGGILGRQIELEIADDGTGIPPNLTKSKTNFEDLVQNKKVAAVVGFFLSEIVVSLMPSIAAAKIPVLDTGSATTETNRIAFESFQKGENAFRFYFRVMINAKVLVLDTGRMAANLFKELNFKKIALLIQGDAFGQLYKKFLEAELPKLGFEIVFNKTFKDDEKNFVSDLSQLLAAKPDAMIISFTSNDGIAFVGQWFAQEKRIPVFGINVSGQAFDYWGSTGGNVISHVYADAATEATAITPLTQPFFAKYTARFTSRPVRPLYTAYTTRDALFLLKNVIEQIKTTEPEAVVKALEQVKKLMGTIGFIEFNGPENPEFYHEAKYGDEFAVPKWVQWQKDAAGNPKREVVFPPQFKTSPFVPPP